MQLAARVGPGAVRRLGERWGDAGYEDMQAWARAVVGTAPPLSRV
jgi:hypothetical protein